ncbi:hypothetical protein ACP4OV_009036 [Aristida adscensionis]
MWWELAPGAILNTTHAVFGRVYGRRPAGWREPAGRRLPRHATHGDGRAHAHRCTKADLTNGMAQE